MYSMGPSGVGYGYWGCAAGQPLFLCVFGLNCILEPSLCFFWRLAAILSSFVQKTFECEAETLQAAGVIKALEYLSDWMDLHCLCLVRQGQVQRQDRAGEVEDEGDDLRRVDQGNHSPKTD